PTATAPPAAPAAAPVDRTAVRDIQSALNRLGYDAGPADGLMGSRTRAAIRQYQTDNRLAVTGEPSRDLLERLSQSLSQAPAPPPVAEEQARPEKDQPRSRTLTGRLARLVDKAEKQRAADAWVIYDLKAVVEEGRGAQRRDDPRLVQGQTARIQSLLEEAQSRQAADQWLVDDLNALVAEHSGPQWQTVVEDAFQDGDYTRNPAWTVASGSFRVEPGLGLRSIVRPPAEAQAQAPAGQTAKEIRPEEIGLAILGSVLQQALGPQGQPPAAAQETDRAEIYLSQPISNAFRMRVELSSRQGQGALILGPYQGGDRRVSYRLVYLPGGPRGLELVRLTHSGSSVVGAYRSPLKLEDGKLHALEWTRSGDGGMTVTLDGREVIRAEDQGINDPFDGFTVVNRGGDYALSEVAIAVSE
nr:peptidoglycan-binding protein [Pseudomonadota bacterium]